jgi:GT2 family glycosyltransferase
VPTVSVVVVNYRRYDLVADCIAALTGGSRPPDEIIVVDNASSPDKADEFAARHPDVSLIRNSDNTGYAAACNQGWRASTGRFVLFINPDVMVDRDCIRDCLAAIDSDPGVGLTTCRLVLPSGRLDHACHRGIPTPSASLAYMLRLHRLVPGSRTFGRYTMSWLDPLSVHDVEACSGAFVLVRRSVLDDIGGWDESYWFYGEDLDLCLRAGKAGWRVRYVGTATATHLKGAMSHLRRRTGSLTPGELATKRRVQAAIVDSHDRFFRQHFASSTSWPLRQMIGATFTAQRVRLRLAMFLDRVTAR